MNVNGFLGPLKGDLLDRRMRPLVALAVIALLGALAYAVLGGSSGSTPAVTARHAVATGPSSSVVFSPSVSNATLAETTSGAGEQQPGGAKDPFGVVQAPASTLTSSSPAASSPASSEASSTSGSSSTSSGSTSARSPAKGPSPAKPRTVYELDALFGEVPAGQEKSSQLGVLDELKLLTPLPSSKVPLLVYRGVPQGGKSATFTVAGEGILSGAGVCKPSAYHCETISLKPGQVEHVAYLPPGSEDAVTYELKIVSIGASEASGSALKNLLRGESHAGLELLRKANLLELPGLRESAVAGVLLPNG
jgi:hypothetical protein